MDARPGIVRMNWPFGLTVEYSIYGQTAASAFILDFKTTMPCLIADLIMKPTGGTASGVHPVPPGFGRVYVKVEGNFSYDKWLSGLMDGHSFVTTGPLLMVEIERSGMDVIVSGSFESSSKPGLIEIVVNGDVAQTVAPAILTRSSGGFSAAFKERIALKTSSWVAVRGFEVREDNRPRFAHSAPVHFQIAGKPLRPTDAQVNYLIKRVRDELARHQGVLNKKALDEYTQALAFYRNLIDR